MSNVTRAEKLARFAETPEVALALFARAPSIRFAAADEAGAPILRTLSAVVVDGRLCFHGADDGEKLGLVGRRAVASCEEIVAQVASYWIHPEHACPASTYYRSALIEGRVERVDDLGQKARILTAIMERFQPEGGYAPIDPADKHYRKIVSELLVCELVPTRVSAKFKLGQHRSRTQIERILSGLWERAAPGDTAAIRAIREAHPERPRPAFLCGPSGVSFCVAPDAHDARVVARLLEGQYWTDGFTLDCMARAQLGSAAWVVARDETERVVASARAVSDHARFGYVLDVIVDPAFRGRGIGRALVALLLAHPALRGLVTIALRTRDAHTIYEPFGFVTSEHDPKAMVRDARQTERSGSTAV